MSLNLTMVMVIVSVHMVEGLGSLMDDFGGMKVKFLL